MERRSRGDLPRRHEDEETLENCRGMIIELAWSFWKSLPSAIKVWISPEDLIAEACVYVLYGALPKYNGSVKKSTFLYTGISNMFLNELVKFRTQKRTGERVDESELFNRGHHDGAYARVDAKLTLERIYQQASPRLKRHMRRWFSPTFNQVGRSIEFRLATVEFKHLACDNRLGPQEFRHLMATGVWL